jgi:hypothetical protein
MLANQKWESFVGIVVWVFILSFVVLAIANLIIYSSNLTTFYTDNARVGVLKESLGNIVSKIDTSQIRENEIFYIYRNESTNNYEVLTGTTNEWFRYIDKFGNHVPDVVAFQDDIYARILWTEREDTTLTDQDQIVRASIRKLIKKDPF